MAAINTLAIVTRKQGLHARMSLSRVCNTAVSPMKTRSTMMK